ncbi:acyclic terpene utilization AtuA family protein [Streptomyces sp. NPDC046939]|uniref:acyclic terpene utilization AtuA family protein n=1 Tax=Streptomyces sp. NPDC046939 TaxID=3155376 RepID=UPI0033E3B8D5
MMGVESIQEALQDGCEVILAGRASDTALFAALPHLKGADPGPIWHMAKTIECGAACAIPPSAAPCTRHSEGWECNPAAIPTNAPLTDCALALPRPSPKPPPGSNSPSRTGSRPPMAVAWKRIPSSPRTLLWPAACSGWPSG